MSRRRAGEQGSKGALTVLSDAERLLLLRGLLAVESDSRVGSISGQSLDRDGLRLLLAEAQQAAPLGFLPLVWLRARRLRRRRSPQHDRPDPPPLGVAGQADLQPAFKLPLRGSTTGSRKSSVVADPAVGLGLAKTEERACVDLVAAGSLPSSEANGVDPHLRRRA